MNQWYCGACGMESLPCMNRARLDRTRCCRGCDGHGIPITELGQQRVGPSGDGIDLLNLMVDQQRSEVRP